MTSDLIEAVSLSAPLSEDWLALSVCLRKPEHEERRGREMGGSMGYRVCFSCLTCGEVHQVGLLIY